MTKPIGVILAAGKGSRLRPITEEYPKPLLPIHGKPLIEYQINLLKMAGVEDIIIVAGHHGLEIARHFGRGTRFGVKFRYAEQSRLLGIAHALTAAAPLINKPFYLFLGDIFFKTYGLHRMYQLWEKMDANAVLGTKIENDLTALKRNFEVICDKNGKVLKVIEKPRTVIGNLKGCGIYFFDLSIFDALSVTPRTAMRDEYELTNSIQILIENGAEVYHCPIILEDVNLTYPKDLLKLNMGVLKTSNQRNYLGQNVIMGENVKIHNSLVGDNVVVEDDVVLVGSLVVSESCIRQGAYIENSIVYGGNVLRC